MATTVTFEQALKACKALLLAVISHQRRTGEVGIDQLARMLANYEQTLMPEFKMIYKEGSDQLAIQDQTASVDEPYFFHGPITEFDSSPMFRRQQQVLGQLGREFMNDVLSESIAIINPSTFRDSVHKAWERRTGK